MCVCINLRVFNVQIDMSLPANLGREKAMGRQLGPETTTPVSPSPAPKSQANKCNVYVMCMEVRAVLHRVPRTVCKYNARMHVGECHIMHAGECHIMLDSTEKFDQF